MSNNSMSYKLEVNYGEIKSLYSKNHKTGDPYSIKKAYEYAEEKHAGVTRGSGEPYINHPLRVARLCTEWGFESDVIIAALLHDVVEDCDTPLSEIEDLFGSVVAKLVDAVTALSDKDFENQPLTKVQKDNLSDTKLQRKMCSKALYIKIADRIDNLNTLSGVKEHKWIPKAEHTREIIIPMVKLQNAYHFVDILEELCFRIEHAQMFEDITKQYTKILNENSRKCRESLEILSNVFNPSFNYESSDLDRCHNYLVDFFHEQRSFSSIYRQICGNAENINTDWSDLLSKENIALYDLTLIVKDDLSEDYSNIRPNDLFFQYFEKSLSPKGFYFIKYDYTTNHDAGYFLLADEMGNMYRLFVRTEREYQRFLYGNIIDEDAALFISDVNEVDPRDTYNEKIKVFRKDGSYMLIDKNATVLDFAFAIHRDLGYHFSYATLDNSKTQLQPYTRLNDGDKITVFVKEDVTPKINWFKYVKTSKATDCLVRYFAHNAT